jgi:hypothetical protein
VNQSLIVDFRLLMEPQQGTSIVNQQSKINNQKFSATTNSCGDSRLDCPRQGTDEPRAAKP